MSAVARPSVGGRLCAKLVLGACLSLWTTAAFADICDRTPAIYSKIVSAVPGKSRCSDITEADLAGVTYLDYIGITGGLMSGDLDGLTGLTYLRIYGASTATTTLPAGVFSDLTALNELKLGASFSRFDSIPAGLFDPLQALTRLSLTGHVGTSIPDDVFDELATLTHLTLISLNLTSLPNGVFDELTALTYLNLNDDLVAGTVIQGRYRYRTGSECPGGWPGAWSHVGELTVADL